MITAKILFTRAFSISSILVAGVLIAGCGVGSESTVADMAGPALSGRVMGGRQPIAGASLGVWQVGNTGYGSAATLLSTTTSDANGNFGTVGHSFSSYTCPSSGTNLLYITASGGNPGNSSGNTNNDILLVEALGTCATAQAATGLNVNEVTTIGAVFALSGFINPATFGASGTTGTTVGTAYTKDAIGASSTNTTGLTNAFMTVGTLVTSNGLTPGTTSNAIVDTQKINTMANILANCVNSDPTAGGTICSTLFGYVSPAGAVTATNTFEVAYYMNTDPTDTVSGTSNLSTVYNDVPATPPYSSALTATPTDWTIGVNYTVSGLTGGQRIAIDGLGDAWVTSPGQISEISPTGGVVTYTGTQGTTTVTSPYGVAVDMNSNVLVTDSGTNSILQFNTTPSYVGVIAGATVTSAEPFGIAIDKSNKAWITETTSSAVGTTTWFLEGCIYTSGSFCTSTAPAAGTNTGGMGIFGIALDKNSTIFTPSRYQSLTGSGSSATAGAIRNWNDNTGAGSNNVAYGTSNPVKAFFPTGAVFDASNNMWFSNTAYVINGSTTYGSAPTNSFITKTPVTSNTYPTPDTVAAANSSSVVTYTGGGLNAAMFIAVDGNSNLWVANSGVNGSTYSVSEFNNSGTAISPATTGFVHTMSAPNDLAVDASGNVWVVSSGAVNYVTQIVGAAAPTVVPIVLNTTNGTWGQKP